MALYKELPVYRDIYQLVLKVFELTKDFSKGYYSKDNEQLALDFGVKEVAIHKPTRKLNGAPINPISQEHLEVLKNRRPGIEPIIGHLKRNWQLGRSRMKSDKTKKSSDYASMMGVNLRQIMRYLIRDALVIT